MSKVNPIRNLANLKVHEESKSSYDSWIISPDLSLIKNFQSDKVPNFSNTDTEAIFNHILEKLKKEDRLFGNISPSCLKRLQLAIYANYRGTNLIDVNYGGDGLFTPTFIEIMSHFIFWIRDKQCVELVTDEDKRLYSKYFWTFEQKCLLTAKYNSSFIKKSA